MRYFLLSLLLAPLVAAQNQNVNVNPPCVLTFTLSANGSSQNFDNRFWGCNNWQVTWETYGSSPASTLTFQQAPSNSAGTAAGTFTTFTGTPILGANPSTATLGNIVIQGNSPWVNVKVAGLSGNVRGMILGCRAPCSLSAGSGGGGGGSSVIVTNFPNIGYGLPACTSSPSRAVISIAGTGNSEVIPATVGKTIKLCKVVFTGNALTSIQFNQGTGTNCGTGTLPITGVMPSVNGLALDLDGGTILNISTAFCISSSVAAALGGYVTYVSE